MATTYKGLTIRIGGDATSLNKSLRGVNAALAQTQRELKKTNKAANLDPSSMGAYNAQLGYMSQRATNVASKLSVLKKALEQVDMSEKSLAVDGTLKSYQDLIDASSEFGAGVEDVAVKLANTNEVFNMTKDNLARTHKEMSKLSKAATKVEESIVNDAMAIALEGKSLEDVIGKYKKLSDGTERSAESMSSISDQISQMSKLFEPGKNGMFDVSAIKEYFETLGSSIGLSKAYINDLLTVVKSINKEYSDQTKLSEKMVAVKSAQQAERNKQDFDRLTKLEKEISERDQALDQIVSERREHERQLLDSAASEYRESVSSDVVKTLTSFDDAISLATAITEQNEARKRTQEEINNLQNENIEQQKETNRQITLAGTNLESLRRAEQKVIESVQQSIRGSAAEEISNTIKEDSEYKERAVTIKIKAQTDRESIRTELQKAISEIESQKKDLQKRKGAKTLNFNLATGEDKKSIRELSDEVVGLFRTINDQGSNNNLTTLVESLSKAGLSSYKVTAKDLGSLEILDYVGYLEKLKSKYQENQEAIEDVRGEIEGLNEDLSYAQEDLKKQKIKFGIDPSLDGEELERALEAAAEASGEPDFLKRWEVELEPILDDLQYYGGALDAANAKLSTLIIRGRELEEISSDINAEIENVNRTGQSSNSQFLKDWLNSLSTAKSILSDILIDADAVSGVNFAAATNAFNKAIGHITPKGPDGKTLLPIDYEHPIDQLKGQVEQLFDLLDEFSKRSQNELTAAFDPKETERLIADADRAIDAKNKEITTRTAKVSREEKAELDRLEESVKKKRIAQIDDSVEHATDADKKRMESAREAVESEERNIERLKGTLDELHESYNVIATDLINKMKVESRFGEENFTFDFLDNLSADKLTDIANAIHNRITGINLDLQTVGENIERIESYDFYNNAVREGINRVKENFAGEDVAEMSAMRRAKYEKEIRDVQIEASKIAKKTLNDEKQKQSDLYSERNAAEKALTAIRERSIAAYNKDVTRRKSDQEKLVAYEARKLEIQRESTEEIERATAAHNEETAAMRAEAAELREQLLNTGVAGNALTVEDALGASENEWRETTNRIAECRNEIDQLVADSNKSIDDATARMVGYEKTMDSMFNNTFERVVARQEKIVSLQDQLANPHKYADEWAEGRLAEIEEKFKNKPTMFLTWRTQFESIMNDVNKGVKMTTEESATRFRELIDEIARYMSEIDANPFDSLESQFNGIRNASAEAVKLATEDAYPRIKEFFAKSKSMLTSYLGTAIKNIDDTKNSVNKKAEEIAEKAHKALYDSYGGNKDMGLLGIQERDIESWEKRFNKALESAEEARKEVEARKKELAELQDIIANSGNSPDNDKAREVARLQAEINELQEKSRSTIADTVGSYDGMSDAVRRLRLEQAHIIDSAVDEIHGLQSEIDNTAALAKTDIDEIRRNIAELEASKNVKLAMYDDDGVSMESARLRQLNTDIKKNNDDIKELDASFEKFKKDVEGWDTSDDVKQRSIAEKETLVLEKRGKLIEDNERKEREAEETRRAREVRRAEIESEYQTKVTRYYDEITAKEAQLASLREGYSAKRAEIIRKANEESGNIQLEIEGHLIDVDALRKEAASAIRQAMIEALGERMPKLTSELFNVANGNTGIEHMSESIKLMAGNVDMSEASMERLVGTLTDLTSRLGESQNAMEALTEATRIRDNINEIILAEAELRKQLEDIGKIDAPSILEKKLYTLNSTIQKISNAYNSLLKRGDTFEKYLEFDKGNANIAEVALRAVSDAAKAALENIQMANEKLGHFDVEHIRAITDASKSVEKQLVDSQSAWLTASTNLKQYEGDLINVQKAIAILEDQLSRVRIKGNEVEDGVVVSEEDEILRGLEDPEEALRKLREEETRLKNLTGELGVEVRKLWKDFEAAKERRDFEDASAGVEQWRAELQKVSATIVDMTQKKAVSEVFGDTSELDEFEKRLKAAVARFETLNKITDLGDKKTFDSSNVELAKRRFDALADVESIVVMYTKSLNDLLESTDTSAIDAVAAKYGSVENAVGMVIQKYGSLRQAMAKFVSGSDDELLVDVEDIARADALLQRLRSIQSLRTDIDAARKLVSDSELSSYKPFSFDRDIFEPVVKSMETFKESSKNAFEPIDRRFKNLTAVIEDAKSKVKAYDDQMKASGETAELVAARDREIERAVAAADERAKLLPDNLAKVAAGLESMGRVGADQRLIDTYGNLNDAIDSLGKKFVGAQAQAQAFKNTIKDFANENELGEEWADALIRVSSKGNISDALFDMILADLPEAAEEGANKLFVSIREAASGLRKSLSETGDIAEDLGLASILSYFQSIEAKAAETGAVVRNSFKQTTKVKLDDSFSKGLEEFSKRMKDFGFNDTGIDEALEDLQALGKQIKSNTDYYDELAKLMKENPKSGFVTSSLNEAADALMSKLEIRIEKTQEAINNLRNSAKIDMDAVSSGTVDFELEKANIEFDKAKEKVKKLEEALKDAKQAMSDASGTEKFAKAKEEVDRLEQELVEVKTAAEEVRERFEVMSNTKVYVTMETRQVTDKANLENMRKQASEGWDTLRDSTNRASSEMMQALQNVGQYFERMGDKIVESSQTIDAAYRDMRKTVNGTESQFESLREEAIKFSQTHAVSSDTILEMESLGGQLGIVVDQLGNFGRVASNLDIATDISANDIALQLGQITNIMSDLDYGTFENFADALVRLGNNAAAQESAIMDVAQRIAAVANVTSMTTPQLLGWSAAIAETGQRSESAATALTKTITGIGQAVSAGGDKLEAFAKIAGMSAEKFENKWKNSSSDALEAFILGLEGLTDESTDAIAALESVGIKSVRQENALLALSQTVENVQDNVLMATDAFNGISDAWGSAGDSAIEADQKSKGFSGTLQIMQNNISNLAASLGDGLIPFMNILSGLVSGLTAFFDGMYAPVKTTITAIGGLLAVLGMIGPEIDQIKQGWAEMNKNAVGGLTGMNKWVYNTGTAIGSLLSSLKMLLVSLKNVGVTMVKNSALGVAANSALKTSVDQVASAETQAIVRANAMKSSMAGLAASAAGVGAAFKALWGVLWPTILISAIISGISMIKEEFDQWKERQDLISSATQSFTKSLGDAKVSVEEYAAGLKSISTTAEQVDEEFKSFLESQASFADTVTESMGNVGKNSAEIDAYSETIKRLSGNVSGNAAELELLQKAVDGYNELAGSSISIIDDTTGAISIQTDAMDLLTESYKKNAETSAWMDIYKNAVKLAAEAKYELEKANLNINQNQARMNQLLEEGIPLFSKERDEYFRLNDANRAYKKNLEVLEETERQRKQDVADAEKIISNLDTEQENLTESVADYSSALSIAGQSVDDFTELSDEQKTKINEIQAALNDSGDSLTNYGEMNKDELVKIANHWNKSVTEIVAYIKQMKAAEEEANAGKPSDQALEEFKRKNEAVYTDAKRTRDDFYDEEKRLRDLYYDRRKNELDDEYDIYKQEKDAEYEYEKRIRDDRYDEYKDQLDDEYEYEKRIRDDAYDERKNQLDDEYEWEKRLRDDAYDDLKDTLDDAYDAAKTAVDDWLDDYKDALDAEVDAFEKATDARIEMMEEEYEAKKKLIDDQEEADTSDIDARIQAIKDQTAAEEKAAKMAERQKKIEEATAKRDKYSEGSKAYEKYALELENLLTEYANEDELERRDKAIEELESAKDVVKENADERRDILKDSYDKEKEAYKTARDEQKELLKAANEEEYEEQKRLKEAELELIKDSNEARLASLKRANEDELTEIKRRLDQELEDYKRANEDELTEIKRVQEKSLEDRKRLHDDELTVIKGYQDQDLEVVKRQQEAHLELLKHYHEQELLEIKRKHEDELTAIKDHIDDENEAYKNGGQAAVDALNGTKTAADDAATSIDNAGSKAASATELHMSDLTGSVQNKLSTLSSWLSSDDPALATAAQTLVTSGADELWKLVEKARQIGVDVPANISSALVNNQGVTAESVRSLVDSISGPISGIGDSARADMEGTMGAIAETLTSKTPETVASANQFVSDMSDELWALVTKADQLGIDVPDALVQSLLNNSEPPKEAAHLLAKGLGDALGDDTSKGYVKTGTWQLRDELGLNFSSEDSKDVGVPLARSAVKGTADALADEESKKQAEGGATAFRNAVGEGFTAEKAEGVGTPFAKALVGNATKDIVDEASSEETKGRLGKVILMLAKAMSSDEDNMGTAGGNSAIGWYNGFAQKMRDQILPLVSNLARSISTAFQKEHEINSPSKLFAWFGEMDAKGYMNALDSSEGDILSMVSRIASDVADVFADADYDYDSVDSMTDGMRSSADVVVERTRQMMDDIVDTMRQHESDLASQAERMARIMEDGFDPTLTAAYEAIDTIDAGKLRKQQAIASAQSVSNVTNAPVINITMPSVVVREQADLTTFSEQIARKVRRELAAALG